MNKYKNIGMALLLLLAAACSDDQVKEDGLLGEAPEGEENISGKNPYWSWVGTFPGWVSTSIERTALTPVEINGVYEKMDINNRIGFQQTPWFSTGFYAAPGEAVTIVKPAGLTGKLKWRIGAWNCTLPETVTLKRYNKVYEEGEITGDTTKAMSYFGGNVYILPEDPFTKPETFLIGGAVKSPDFISGKTDPAVWREEIKNTKVPFAELIGKRCIWTMPVAKLAKITNPQELLDLYDDVIENDFNALHGFSDNAGNKLDRAPSFPVRIVEDLQLCDGQSHTGYPIMLDMSDGKIGTDYDDMRSTNVALNFYKEIGHDYQTWCWSWLDIKDIANLLPYYHSRSRLLRNWPASETTDWDLVISEYVKRTSSDKSFGMGSSGIGEQLNKNNARVMPFIQLAQKYGWKLYAYVGKCARELSKEDAKILKVLKTDARMEFFCKRVCEYANADLRPFFDAWGMKYGPYAADDMKQLPAYTGEKFWEKWDATLIPDFDRELTPSSIKLADDNYNNVAAAFDQTLWSVDSCSKTGEGKPEYTINGKIDKNDNSAYFWGSDGNGKRPVYNPQPWLAYDMKKAYNVDRVYLFLRNFSYSHVHPETFKVEVKMNPEDEWKFLGEFQVTYTLHKWFELKAPKSIPGRYIRVTFVRGQLRSGKPDWNYSEAGGVSVDEFKCGGTLYIDSSEDDPGNTGDPDFPVWN